MTQPKSKPSVDRRLVATICRRLARVHGAVEPPPRAPVLDELVATILSQNTSDANSDAAYAELRARFPDWDAVRQASVAKIADAIRQAGLARQKAPRIKAILNQIHREHGRLSLDFLRDLPDPDARDYLRKFKGVGPKTAACVLLFACGKSVMPVDTHVHRVSRRLGLIGRSTTAEKAHDDLARLVPPRLVLGFHLLLIRHGRAVCVAAKPLCRDCVLLDLCPTGKTFLASESSK